MDENTRCKKHINKHNRLNKFLNRNINFFDIKIAIDNLKNNKSPGNDNILNDMIKNRGIGLIRLLKDLFNKCLKDHIFPKQLKESDTII